MTCICASTNRCSARLSVVALLQGLDVLWLLCALGQQYELVQALVHDRQVCPELTLPWHHIPARSPILITEECVTLVLHSDGHAGEVSTLQRLPKLNSSALTTHLASGRSQ